MTTPLSDERVVAMRARIEAVESSYPGEWGSWWAPDAREGAVIANPIPTFDPWTGERDEDEQLFLVYDIPDDESAQALLAFAQHAKVDMSDLLAEVERLRKEVLRREIALTSLTPLGSEWCNVPEKCAEFSRNERNKANARWHEWVRRLKESQAEITRLRSRVALLEGVLREVEWIEPEPTPRAEPYCLWCEAVCDNHAPDCELAAALRGDGE